MLGQGVLKYSHSTPIQALKFNPSKLLLVSCSDLDFGFWSPEQKQVAKEKVLYPAMIIVPLVSPSHLSHPYLVHTSLTGVRVDVIQNPQPGVDL